MIAFRVFRNGSEVCLAGIEGLGVLTTIVTWANRAGEFTESGQPEESLDLTIGALHTATKENRIWPTHRLSVGERITIQIEDSENIMQPAETRIYSEEAKLEAMKQSARDLAEKLGWRLIETPDQEAGPFMEPIGPSAEQSRPRSIVYVDVDDTLVRSVGTTRIPMAGVIEHVRRLKADGAQLYLWSAGGADYCRTTAQELGIEDCFAAFLPKPRIMIDDQEVADWVFCATFHPSACTGRTLQDYFTL